MTDSELELAAPTSTRSTNDSDPRVAAAEFSAVIAARSPAAGQAMERGRAIAEIVDELGVEPEVCAAASLFPLLEDHFTDREALAEALGDDIARLCQSLVALGAFGFPANWSPETGLDGRQADALRKMLIAIVEDVRLVLVRLADQLHRLRSMKNAADDERRRAALETREIYAPLANRLGIWQLKWEMEDMAFRFLEPDTYQKIARLLAERRVDREAYIERVIKTVRDAVAEIGVTADVQGRPKHIYSIYRKMSRKKVDFDHVFDVRAIRVLVDTVADCYSVLGIVHGKWNYIPGEFDDYIATPKENDYRSLHTAVVGPEGKPLEIQIRTYEMHEHAELGVAAHWQYKEGRGGATDPGYHRKINWLRQILEPSDPEESGQDFIDRFKSEIFEDRVYVLTPNGDVVDLPQGATPLDFAYHLHTDLGHRCRGAKVNGRMVTLTYKLQNGEQVDIITSRSGTPSRDWLLPKLGYLASSRARSKVRVWFRRQDQQHNLEQGRLLLEKELQRLGMSSMPVQDLALAMHLGNPTTLYVALGNGDVTLEDVVETIQKQTGKAEPEPIPEPRIRARRPTPPGKGHGVEIDGVGDLMTSLAQCCKPVPPDPIEGYITLGRGVTIHRSDCANMLRLQSQQPERVLAVAWSSERLETYPVDVEIEAFDRQGLIKDISTLLAAQKINIIDMKSSTDKNTMSTRMRLTLEIGGLDALSGLLHRIGNLPNVTGVRRCH